MTQFEHAYGAILGAFVGDALGAPLEFAGLITDEKLANALEMGGGGGLRIGQGQITDDSELAMCQIQALKGLDPKTGFPWENLIRWYRKWEGSNPFDIGGTTIRAFGQREDEELKVYIARVAEVNDDSKSNGSMMRMTPLSIWVRNLDEKTKAEYLRNDSILSHPNQSVQDACAAYGLAISELINTEGDNDQTISTVEKWVNKNANDQVKEWILADSNADNFDEFNMTLQIGYVKWGTILSFHHLRHKTEYAKAIKSTLLKGGDTDTNAAITGGMLGALHGKSKIPEKWRNKVLQFRKEPEDYLGHKRPTKFQPGNLDMLVKELFEKSM